VTFDPKLGSIELLNQAVEKAGCHVGKAEIPAASGRPAAEATDEPARARERDIRDLKQRALVSLAIGLGLMALMYLPLHLDSRSVEISRQPMCAWPIER
jgi:Cu+-exporting ATPase